MAYEGFACYYDALNQEADYDRLAKEVDALFTIYDAKRGVVVDLGCGTGELTLRLAKSGYDIIAVDASTDMLNALQNKIGESGCHNILLLCQQLENLDMYGTITGAVSTFDTFNHLSWQQLDACIQRVSLFMESEGILIFDMNTPYKHKEILGNNIFIADSLSFPDVVCEWENKLDIDNNCTNIYLEFRNNDEVLFSEEFTEYYYSLKELLDLLEKYSFSAEQIRDGESFAELTESSQRMLIVAKKI